MGHLKLIMSDGNKKAELELEKTDEKQRNDTVMGLFRFFGDKAAISSPVIEVSTPKPNAAPQEMKVPAPPPLSVCGTITVPPPQKPEKPALIGSERTLATSIGEIASGPVTDHTSSVPDHYKTGIKYKDGIAHFKMRYWCQNDKCRDKANDYITADQRIVNCRQCGMALAVMPAAPKGERDGYGNFFVATKPAPGAMG